MFLTLLVSVAAGWLANPRHVIAPTGRGLRQGAIATWHREAAAKPIWRLVVCPMTFQKPARSIRRRLLVEDPDPSGR